MACVPPVSVLVVKVAVATPPAVVSVSAPLMSVAPSKKLTVPDGTRAVPTGATVAVKVTAWP